MAAANLGLADRRERLRAGGDDLHVAADPERAGHDPSLEDQVGASVRQHDARNAAARAQVRRPGVQRGRGKQAAFLLLAAAKEVFVVERALGARGCAHGLGRQTRVM